MPSTADLGANVSYCPPDVPPASPPPSPTRPNSRWRRAIAFLGVHPARRAGVNWTIRAVAALVAIGVLGSCTATTTTPGNRTTSLQSGTAATRSVSTASRPSTTHKPKPPPTRSTSPRPVYTTASSHSTPTPRIAPVPPPASPLTCSASISTANPADYSTIDVIAHTGVSGAAVTATAHYKTTDTTHSSIAAGNGVADVAFEISRATPGYTVTVDVTVTARGASKSCSTAFTPQ